MSELCHMLAGWQHTQRQDADGRMRMQDVADGAKGHGAQVKQCSNMQILIRSHQSVQAVQAALAGTARNSHLTACY